MDLIRRYNRIHKDKFIPYITLESLLEDIRKDFLYSAFSDQTIYKMKSRIREEVINRGLDSYFQVIIRAYRYSIRVDFSVNKINRFYPPEECVIVQWN
ncbi:MULTISPECIES: hypothetical protein [Bacillus cereus group]|uniref:hypothetical protein n=1 Tax=Bacillus cereus group sp. BfR-BA-01494 TaxID=2920362 RepID=UPI0012988DA3|nr:hypothetical protein [Bacillus cereus]MRC76363.1 hypothetical protein [Bacillus thuringiensis]MRD18456.1 hypothetical protein [Bacillus thuringiensis]